jgi:hypothetical protein
MYLPTKVRNQMSYERGVMLIWSEQEIQKLKTLGDAVPAGPGGVYRIPQHHAKTFEDAMYIIGGYRRLAENIGFHCVFRGQTRDYYDTTGVLIVLPGIIRSPELYEQYLTGGAVRDSLAPWLKVLKDLGIETGTGLNVKHTLSRRDGSTIRGNLFVNHPVALLRANPEVASILQHYGFPTDHLDASTDPVISLWFALHESQSKRGRISFRRLTPRKRAKRGRPPRPTDTADVPTLHVYLQPVSSVEDLKEDFPLVDLSRLEALTLAAKRPTRQSAVSMPCGAFGVSQYSPRLHPTLSIRSPNLRWPAGIIKLYFPFESVERPDLTAKKLFPKSEPLYRSLIKINAPHLAIYE